MSERSEPIKGKVAKILNSRELALNIGMANGVKIGMKFDVLDPKGENIQDPETQEILGSLCRPKVRVKVISVQDRLSVASTYRKRKLNVGGKGPNLSYFALQFMPEKWIDRQETLKTDEVTWEDLEESESFVKTGDPVVEVKDDEAVDD